MQGVEILDTTVHYVREFSLVAFLAPIIVIGLVGFIFCLLDGDFWDGVEGLLIGSLIGIFFGVMLTICTSKKTDKIDYVEYKVTVSDEVNFNEFHDKYEIIDQEGKIYTVRERE